MARLLLENGGNSVPVLEKLLDGRDSATFRLAGSDHNLFELLRGVPHDPVFKAAIAVIQKNEPYDATTDADAPEWLRDVAKRARERSLGEQFSEQYMVTIHPECPPPSLERNSLLVAFGLSGKLLKLMATRRRSDPVGELRPTGSRDLLVVLGPECALELAAAIVGQIDKHAQPVDIQNIA